MSLKVNISGSWREVPYPKVNISGTWRDVQNIYVKADGSWRPIYGYWYEYTEYSACSASCGPGTQTRTATCYRTGNVAVSDTLCSNAGVYPVDLTVDCNLGSCWDTGMEPDSSLMLSGSTVYNVGGRSVYRHISNKGSIIQWKDKTGTIHRTLVLDAAYRSKKYWMNDKTYIDDYPCYGTYPSGMTEYNSSSYTAYYIGSGTSTINESYDSISEIVASPLLFTDEIINSRSTYFEDNHTSTYNTDCIINHLPSGDFAAQFCRSNGSGISADLPNVQTLIRVFICAEKINILDPTISSYSTFSLYNIVSVWSSTYGGYHPYTYSAWNITSAGRVRTLNQDSYLGCGTIPTLDL